MAAGAGRVSAGVAALQHGDRHALGRGRVVRAASVGVKITDSVCDAPAREARCR